MSQAQVSRAISKSDIAAVLLLLANFALVALGWSRDRNRTRKPEENHAREDV